MSSGGRELVLSRTRGNVVSVVHVRKVLASTWIHCWKSLRNFKLFFFSHHRFLTRLNLFCFCKGAPPTHIVLSSTRAYGFCTHTHIADRMFWVVSAHNHFPTILIAPPLLSYLRLQIKSFVSSQTNNFTNIWTFKLHLNISQIRTKFLKVFCIFYVMNFRDVWTLLRN